MDKSAEERIADLEAQLVAMQNVLMSLAASCEHAILGLMEETRQFSDAQMPSILNGKHPVASVHINAILDDLTSLKFRTR